uniref:Endoplasmin n=2 Tax=Schistocephalus solidus TaxID=70667 RepID=A0A0X3PMK1_SCHSO
MPSGERFLWGLCLIYVTFAVVHVLCDISEPDLSEVKSSSGTRADDSEDLEYESLRQSVKKAEKHVFETNVDKMMKLIINSLYKNKDIFLREQISNAVDALEKIRFLSVTDSSVLESLPDLNIRIKVNEKDKTISIRDTGIGMTREDLKNNLGTIAKSGTADFMKQMENVDNQTSLTDLIGQFGVGFYSAFIVADRVTVVSKSSGDKQHIWESDSTSFQIVEDPRGDTLVRGTEIILHIKEEAREYLQISNLKEVVNKYSQFVTFPIYLWDSRTEQVTEEPEEVKPADTSDDVTVEEDTKEKEKKKVEKTVWDWVEVNKQKPLWTRKPSEVAEEEYTALFKAFTSDYQELLAKVHFEAEGEVSFKSILFIPKKARYDLYNGHKPITDNIKLYVRRVFITNNLEEMLPRYLAFVYGVVDSDNLPLNVSRETLQQSKLLKLIKKKLVRKIIELISKLPKKDYEEFWKQYSVSIKLGVLEDQPNKSKLTDLLRFPTSHSETDLSSFDDYISRMKDKQDTIYYVGGSSIEDAKTSPFVEKAIRKGFEVIYMTEPMDEFVMQALTEVKSKKLQDLAKEGVTLGESESAKHKFEEQKTAFAPLTKWLKDTALEGLIKDATVSQRLHGSPCALVADQYSWSGNFERIMTNQAFQSADKTTTAYYMSQKKTLEINPHHPLMKELLERVQVDQNDEKAKENALLLFETATLRSGYQLKDPAAFVERVERMMRNNLGVGLDESVEPDDDDLSSTDDAENLKPASDFQTESTDESDQQTSSHSKEEL